MKKDLKNFQLNLEFLNKRKKKLLIISFGDRMMLQEILFKVLPKQTSLKNKSIHWIILNYKISSMKKKVSIGMIVKQ